MVVRKLLGISDSDRALTMDVRRLSTDNLQPP